ncbi:MAG TPA: TolC family protein [Puia sp.]|jgi:outer membrane protein TolC|nr:TolC family protein [Puia sp.]
MPKSLLLLLLAGLVLYQPLAAQISGPLIAAAASPTTPAVKTTSLLATPAASPRMPAAPSSAILDGYLNLALDSNLALHQRNFDLQKAQLDLRRAKSLFFPQATASSEYTLANGGRSIGIPIGNLLNNVYSTLNQLTASNKFPQVANQSVQFLPNNFQDTKMEVSMPILNTDLQHNREVSAERINGSRADRDIYSRDLIRSIRQAYYQYLQAGKAAEIYNNALQLAQENKRVSEKFVANQMATREIVLRAQAQVSETQSSLIEARNNMRNAAAWFNFLLNRPLDYPITTDAELMGASADASLMGASDPLSTVHPPADPLSSERREEFTRLTSYQRILESNLKWDRAYLIPKLNAFYDAGFQGYGIHFNSSQFYQLAGVQLFWPLFKANDNKYKIRQAIIDIQSVHEQYQQLTDQVNLEQVTAVNNYNSALEALPALTDEVTSARETYRLAERRFNEGQALQIELIDSRNQMTNAELRYSLGRLALLNRAADLERVTATFPINNQK